MFKQLFGGKSAVAPSKLPTINSFIDVIVAGRTPRQVAVESIDGKSIVTRETLGKVGDQVVIMYQGQSGRYRAATKIAAIGIGTTQLDTPKRVSLIGAAPRRSQKRQSVRLDAIVNGMWRFAPGGVGQGDYMKATIGDISRGGAALIIDRELRLGTQVEVKIPLKAEGTPLEMLCEVMRYEEIEQSGKHSHGMRFLGVRPGEDQAIVEFINQRQAKLRSRGLA